MGIIVDNFAGGGGASTGIELALGRHVDIAINHDSDAIALHKANHPFTKHYQEDVWAIDPIKVCNGRQVDLAWFSPDCTHFSKAKGGKPVSKKIRGLAWVSLRWAALVRPKVIILENVEEFKTWGPIRRGRPIKSRKGETFKKFIHQYQELGYEVKFTELIAADYGAPTKRKRFFMIARSDDQPIVWPKPLYAPREKAKKLGLLPYRSAASIIDWSIPCPSIFDRKKPLSEATMRRIARGLEKFVFSDKKPFIIPIGYGEAKGQKPRIHDIEDPLPTIVSSNKHHLIVPYLVDYHFNNTSISVEEPHRTITSVRGHYLVAPFIQQYFTGASGSDIESPLPTVTAWDHNALTSAFLIKYYGNGNNVDSINDPFATITSKAKFGLIKVKSQYYKIVDIGMRMLTPRELYNAQGFPPDYIIDKDFNGKKYPISKQIARCGNAVPPPFAEALVRANLPFDCSTKNIISMKQLLDYNEQLHLV